MTFYELLNLMEKRPKMFFSEVNTLAIEAYISGYRAAHKCNKINESCNVCNFGEFDDWVKCRLHSEKCGLGWRQLLLEHFEEQTALEKCFVYINEFKNRKFNTIAEIKNTQMQVTEGIKNVKTVHTTNIYLGKYTSDPGYWIIFSNSKINSSGFYYDIEFFEMLIGISREDWVIHKDSKID